MIFKARSHDAFFPECDCDFFIACNGLRGCQWYCSHGATAMHFCVRHRIQMGFIPILCDCDVRFQWMRCAIPMHYIANRIHQCIAPCEQNHQIACNIPFSDRSRIKKKTHRVNEPLRISFKIPPLIRWIGQNAFWQNGVGVQGKLYLLHAPLIFSNSSN